MEDSCWVFGLSIDEKIEWRFSEAIRQGGSWLILEHNKDRLYGSLDGHLEPKYEHNLQGNLRDIFLKLKEIIPLHVLENVSSVGVTTAGLADRVNLQLVSIARREDWVKPLITPVLQFRELFDGVFPRIDVSTKWPRINLHNDATARCLAEWHYQKEVDAAKSIFFVTFSDGVNASFVSQGEPMHTELHTELGHIWPRPHRLDFHFNVAHSGCRIHRLCFEGLASAKRISETWARGQRDIPLSELPAEASDVISFYVAQMIMNGVLGVSPQKVLLGGKTLSPDLLPDIKGYFDRFNDGGTEEPYLKYDAMLEDGFIRMAQFGHEDAGIIASLELARLVLENGFKALRPPGRRRRPGKRGA